MKHPRQATVIDSRQNARSMRRRLLLLLLPLFMLFAQQGAAWHELSHYHFGSQGASSTASANKQKPQPADTVCEQCLAFAGIAGMVAPQVPALDLLSFSHALPPAVALHAAAIDAPSPRSRGPPIVL